MTTTPSPNSEQTVLNNQNLFTGPWYIYMQAIYKAIRARFKINLSGMLSVNTQSFSNSGSGETNLTTYEFAKNDMQNDGDILTIKAAGYFSANSNNKTLKLKFGSQTIFDTGAIAANNTSWEINATIIRVSNNTQKIYVSAISNNTAYAQRLEGTQDLSNNIIIKCTGQSTSSNDLTEDLLIIGLTPND